MIETYMLNKTRYGNKKLTSEDENGLSLLCYRLIKDGEYKGSYTSIAACLKPSPMMEAVAEKEAKLLNEQGFKIVTTDAFANPESLEKLFKIAGLQE